MAEFTEAEKDMILLGVLGGIPMNVRGLTHVIPSRHKQRQHQRTTYMVDSKVVCRETFKFIYGISQNKLTALLKVKHFLEHGLSSRQKWGGRMYNTKALSPKDVKRVVHFLCQKQHQNSAIISDQNGNLETLLTDCHCPRSPCCFGVIFFQIMAAACAFYCGRATHD